MHPFLISLVFIALALGVVVGRELGYAVVPVVRVEMAELDDIGDGERLVVSGGSVTRG